MATYKVRLISKKHNLDTTIDCPDDLTIVEAAAEAGIDLPVSCNAGACSSCVGKVVEGEINQDGQKFLDKDQEDAGFALLCVTYAVSDCTIKTHQEPYLV